MSNDDPLPLPARLLLAVARRGLPPAQADVLARLGAVLALELAPMALPIALLRLRRHVRGDRPGR
ncbi:hypothetical protein [Rathayibacter sp. SD072]|uniref:hypothetical protein n=1 Tax=Rathayibacter sp. SD072 TaxID=2781731 RepID=UPI001A96EECA|nr:hypothetical protein [Rathayibacter sp. SD072]MBO0982503.1 hypothetical protein [Rathayibacter sp. SD072]